MNISRIEKLLAIADEHILFSGHFPGFAVFPAVGEISLVTELLSDYYQQPINVTKIKRAKFLNLVRPGSRLRVALDLQGPRACHYIISDETQVEKIFAKGTIEYARD